MKIFSQLTPRAKIQNRCSNMSQAIIQREIAERVGVSISTISPEKRRNSRPRASYQAKLANEMARKRRYKKPFKIQGEL